MSGTSIGDRIATWVQEAIDQGCLGDDYGYEVLRQGKIGFANNNGKVDLNYLVIITHRHPLLQQADGMPHAPIMGGFLLPVNLTADEAKIKDLTGSMMEALAAKFRQETQALRSGRKAGLIIPGDPGSTHPN